MIIKLHACCQYSNLVWTRFVAHLILSIFVLTQTNPLLCVGNFLWKLNKRWMNLSLLTKEIILLANTQLHTQSERLAGVKNDLRTIRLKVMTKRSSDQLCKTARTTVNDTTSNERTVTSNNPLPAFTTADLFSESNIPGISSTVAGTNGTLFREATADQSQFAPYFPQGVGTSQRMSSTFQKSIYKVIHTVFNGDPLLWLDWVGLFNATIHSSVMTTAEK